jgi:hypothetical protein
MKISKASWMILGAGVFIIALTGLGVARSGQVQEQKKVTTDLTVNTARLNNLQVSLEQSRINELEQEVKDAQSQTGDIKNRLIQSVISVDVADKFYEIAGFYSVNVTSMGTSTNSEQPFTGIPCEIISLSASVSGTADNIIDFVKGLNDNFITGFIRSAQLDLKDPLNSSVSLQMIVYSYKGNQDGQ